MKKTILFSCMFCTLALPVVAPVAALAAREDHSESVSNAAIRRINRTAAASTTPASSSAGSGSNNNGGAAGGSGGSGGGSGTGGSVVSGPTLSGASSTNIMNRTIIRIF